MKLNSLQLKIDKEIEKILVETVIEDFKSAEDARAKKDYGKDSQGTTLSFDSKIKRLKDMYYGKREPKTVPWRNCSNRSLKISMAIIDMLHSRMFPAVWNEDMIRWRPGDKTDRKKAERITLLMDWWVRVKTRMKDYFDRWTKVALGFGQVVTEVCWDIKYVDQGETTTIPIIDEFGIQLYEKDGTPSVKTEKKFKIVETTKQEIIPWENVYLQPCQTDFCDETVIFECNWNFSQLEALENEGKAVNVSKPLFEEGTTLRSKLEGFINENFAFSNNENANILKEVKLRATPVKVLKCYKKIDIDRDGFAEDVRILIDPLRRIYLGGLAIKDISKKGLRPIDITKVNDLIDATDSLEGYGFLEMILPLAEEIDAIFNQLTDANTLSVLRPGFYDPAGNLTPQNLTLAPNKLIPVPEPQRNIYFPDFQIATERLLVALRAVMEFIERLTGASSYIMGKESEIVGGSGTATRTQAIVNAAEQRFAMPAEKLRAGASRILNIILDQIQKNIPPGLENRILGEEGEPVFGVNELTEEGISGEFDAYILEDAAMGSYNAERQLMDNLYMTLLQNPLVLQSPVNLYRLTADRIKVYKKDPVDYLGPEPEGGDFHSAEEENTMIMQGDFAQVRAKLTENHIQHIYSHQNLLHSPSFLILSPETQQHIAVFVQSHIQEHQTMFQQMLQLQTQFGGVNGQRSTQTNAGQQGLGNIPGPFGEVEKQKERGTSELYPSMQS